MQNSFESGAQALTGSILMKILLATRGTTTDLPSSVQRPDGSTILGHRGRTPGHQGHPGRIRVPESRKSKTTGSTNPGIRMPRIHKLLLERTNPTPITTTMTTTTTLNPGHSSPTTKKHILTSLRRRQHHPATILCRCRSRSGSPITCRSTIMKWRPSTNSDTWARSDRRHPIDLGHMRMIR